MFVNIPSQISRTLYKNNNVKEKNLAYAALPTVLDYIETGIDEYKPTTKEEKIDLLYKSINPLYLNIEIKFAGSMRLFRHVHNKKK